MGVSWHKDWHWSFVAGVGGGKERKGGRVGVVQVELVLERSLGRGLRVERVGSWFSTASIVDRTEGRAVRKSLT